VQIAAKVEEAAKDAKGKRPEEDKWDAKAEQVCINRTESC
jgi:hypothetical protein